jgi:hypothetical protein
LVARKSSKKVAKKARKGAAKASSKSKIAADISSGRMMPYGPPIFDAIARGDLNEMRQVAAATRKWLDDVQTAVNKLETNIKKLSGS